MKYTAENRNIDHIKGIISGMPKKPGIYQFFDLSKDVIYIGKAKCLKNRVSSYFNNKHESRKTALLVKNVVDIKYLVVETEQDALLLENNLIKKYQPRYNIRLKDDKTYPWICIKNEPFPRVFRTRTLIRDGSKYFGPYTSLYMVNTLLELFRSEYKLRNCKFNLSEDNINRKKFRVCLEYHIGNCRGPCEGFISREEYDEGIDEIKNILKGNISGVIQHLQSLMDNYSKDMKYEDAQEIKEKFDSLKRYQSKSTIVSPTITDVDIFSIDQNKKFAYINYLKVINGAIIQTYTLEIKKRLDEPQDELLMAGIIEIRLKIYSNAKEILVPFHIDSTLEGINIHVPQRGEKKKLLDLSIRNAKYFRIEKEKMRSYGYSRQDSRAILSAIQKDLNLEELPYHIECFDNSNIQGTTPVAACVVFKNGKPSNSDYRHYNIKTVKGQDDFASMEEVVYRRYKRLLEEERPLPQLIVIDGGKGQLTAAMEAVGKLGLKGKIVVISLAKRLEYIYFPGETGPVVIDKNSSTLKILQQLRDEAHRFGISFHRNKRSKLMTNSELEDIKGIGEQTIKKLFTNYKSVKNIKNLSMEHLSEVVGKAKGKIIFDYFHRI